MRKVIFWIHLSAGVMAGLVILVMAATGVLLTYEKQLIAWADARQASLTPDPVNPRLPVDQLLASARAAAGDARVSALTVSSVPGAPVLVTVGPRTIALNPYSGAVLGDASPGLRGFFRSVTTWHRYLGAGAGELRQRLRLVTGWGNALFLLIVLGGPFLWLPKKWSLAQVRNIGWFRGGLRGKARDFNWHNAIGIWSCVPLIVIVASALPMSFQWANAAVYRLAGEEPPAAQGAGGARGASEARGAASANASPIEPLWQKAERQVDGWRTITARFAANPNAPLSLAIDRGTGGQPQLRGTLTLDRATGAIVRWETFEAQGSGRRARTFTRFAHTGEYFGLVGQTIAGLASAGAVVLVWTGLALALRRLQAWRTRRRASATPAIARRTAA